MEFAASVSCTTPTPTGCVPLAIYFTSPNAPDVRSQHQVITSAWQQEACRWQIPNNKSYFFTKSTWKLGNSFQRDTEDALKITKGSEGNGVTTKRNSDQRTGQIQLRDWQLLRWNGMIGEQSEHSASDGQGHGSLAQLQQSGGRQWKNQASCLIQTFFFSKSTT